MSHDEGADIFSQLLHSFTSDKPVADIQSLSGRSGEYRTVGGISTQLVASDGSESGVVVVATPKCPAKGSVSVVYYFTNAAGAVQRVIEDELVSLGNSFAEASVAKLTLQVQNTSSSQNASGCFTGASLDFIPKKLGGFSQSDVSQKSYTSATVFGQSPISAGFNDPKLGGGRINVGSGFANVSGAYKYSVVGSAVPETTAITINGGGAFDELFDSGKITDVSSKLGQDPFRGLIYGVKAEVDGSVDSSVVGLLTFRYSVKDAAGTTIETKSKIVECAAASDVYRVLNDVSFFDLPRPADSILIEVNDGTTVADGLENLSIKIETFELSSGPDDEGKGSLVIVGSALNTGAPVTASVRAMLDVLPAEANRKVAGTPFKNFDPKFTKDMLERSLMHINYWSADSSYDIYGDSAGLMDRASSGLIKAYSHGSPDMAIKAASGFGRFLGAISHGLSNAGKATLGLVKHGMDESKSVRHLIGKHSNLISGLLDDASVLNPEIAPELQAAKIGLRAGGRVGIFN